MHYFLLVYKNDGSAQLKPQENMISWIVATFVLAFSFCAWSLLNLLWLRPRKLEKCLGAQGLCGKSYRLFDRDFREMSKKLAEARTKPIDLSDDIVPRILPFQLETVKKYGRCCFIWRGTKPIVIIQDPELVREILQKNDVFPKLEPHPVNRYLFLGLLTSGGEKWAKSRKIINPAFHMQKLKQMVPAFRLCASEMLSKWDEKITAEGSGEVDVWPYLETLTSDGISRTAFGSNYEEGRRIFELQKEQLIHFAAVLRSFYFPGLRFLPTKRYRRMKYINKEVLATVKGIVDKRVEAMKAGEASKSDLLGILLESNHKEIEQQGDRKFGMSIEDIVEECRLFYFSGEETTTSMLVWTMVLLSMHQEWQSRAREEVLQVFGRDDPNFDGLNHLKIVTMILNEVLRLYPPISFLIRGIQEETKVGKFTLPDGVQLLLPVMLLHHDLEIWGDDAKEFKPDRFSEGVSNATNGQVPFFPFGWGPRICIGQTFAMLEAKLAMAMILQHFSFELSPSYTHAPVGMAIIRPQHGAHLVLHKL